MCENVVPIGWGFQELPWVQTKRTTDVDEDTDVDKDKNF